MVLALNETTDAPGNPTHAALGPYENWMMTVGKYYDLPGLQLNYNVCLSCIAEFETPVDYDTFLGNSQLDLGTVQRTILLPTLHRNKGFTARFIPFLLTPFAGSAVQKSMLSRSGAELSEKLENRSITNPGGPLGDGGQLRLNFPVRTETVNEGYQQVYPEVPPVNDAKPDPALGGNPPKVILAIIDLGIPFAHANFRNADGLRTRIDYCWAQSAPKETKAAADVLFGREFTKACIDQMIHDTQGDEDAIYRDAGLLGRVGTSPMPLDRMHSHGAHVLDTLAGRWDPKTAAEARIIAVDLPASSTWETSGFGKDMFVLSALHYIFDRAARIQQTYGCRPLPLVINLSYGYSGGPHDGTGLIEEAIAELIAERNNPDSVNYAPTFIVMPSGNMFQDRLFAQITDAHFETGGGDDKVASLQWFAPPCDRTSSYLECWFPQGTTPDQVRIVLTPPGGPALPVYAVQKDAAYFSANIAIDHRIVGLITIDRGRKFSPTARVRATVILAPTETPVLTDEKVKDHSAAPAGLWTIQVLMPGESQLPTVKTTDGTIQTSTGIACRIQRDTSYGQGNTGAQQGYFVDPLNQRYDDRGKLTTMDIEPDGAKVRRFGSMNGMATSPTTVVVGGSSIWPEQAAAYSSAGAAAKVAGADKRATRHNQANDRKVDISAASERSVFLPGMTAAGTRSGITVAFQGTSTSAPQVARALGAALMDGRAATVDDCLALLAQAGVTRPVTDLTDSPAGQPRLGRVLLTTAPPIAGSEQIDAQGPG